MKTQSFNCPKCQKVVRVPYRRKNFCPICRTLLTFAENKYIKQETK